MAQEIQQLLFPAKMAVSLDAEVEPYILTPEEENQVKRNTILAIQKHLAWKWKGLGGSEETILKKISEQNWENLDFAEALQYANMCKHSANWHEEQNKKRVQDEINSRKELVKACSAKYLYNLMRHTSFHSYDKELILNEYTTPLIRAVCLFLSEDPRFETELGYSFKKGLWIRGEKGLGKTHTVSCVADNPLNPVLIISTIEVSEDIRANGNYKFEMGDRRKIYIDDVGTEEPLVNHYGTKITFFKSFIESRYLKQKVFNNLMVSTNEDFNSIEEKYGGRVRSRIKDMFNIIHVTGSDMRGM